MSIEGVTKAMSRIEEITSKIQKLLGSASESARPDPTRATDPASFRSMMDEASARPGESDSSSGRGRFVPDELRPLISSAAARHGVSPQLLESVARRESGFNPRAVSPKGAQGLMQLMPDTQKLLGVTNPFDPAQSLDGGARYLRMMSDRFGGDQSRMLAAYNAGPQAVERFNGVPPYRETHDYLNAINLDIGADPDGDGE